MMRRKDLEITLQMNVKGFENPKIALEQYQTPARVAANLLHRAFELGDIKEKKIIDVCAGTGILGIAANLLGADVTVLEIDADSVGIMKDNIERMALDITVMQEDLFQWAHDAMYDTALVNPPFGINKKQKQHKDMDFIRICSELSAVIWSIHDGSPTNQKKLPELFQKNGLEILEIYIDDFPLSKSFGSIPRR